MYRGGTAVSGVYRGTVSRRTPGCGVGATAIMRERERESLEKVCSADLAGINMKN